MHSCKIGFIGAGNMAASLIGGLLKDGFNAQQLWVSDVDDAKLDKLEQTFGIHTSGDNRVIANQVDILVLAVKPQMLQDVLKGLHGALSSSTVLLSVAAGVRATDIERWAGGKQAVVRAMPNTPSLVQTGATALYANRYVNDTQHQTSESIMRAVGITLWIDDESEMDAVTAVSGSGPAYFFLVMEAMEAAGIKLGLSAETARLLTLQTAFGATKLALESGGSMRELRHKVTSPGGTTEQAVNVLQAEGLEQAFDKALQAASKRSKELADQLGGN